MQSRACLPRVKSSKPSLNFSISFSRNPTWLWWWSLPLVCSNSFGKWISPSCMPLLKTSSFLWKALTADMRSTHCVASTLYLDSFSHISQKGNKFHLLSILHEIRELFCSGTVLLRQKPFQLSPDCPETLQDPTLAEPPHVIVQEKITVREYCTNKIYKYFWYQFDSTLIIEINLTTNLILKFNLLKT